MVARYNSSAIWVLALVVTAYLLCLRFLRVKRDPREPRVIPPTIPLIGHIIGILRYGNDYYGMINASQQLPVFTIEIFGTKTYVVNSLDMVAATQRNTKTLSFNPFLLWTCKAISQFDKAGLAVIENNIEGAQGKWGYIPEMLEGVHQTLAPGPALDQMNHAILNKLCPAINGLRDGDTFELQAWTRGLFSVCSLASIYGPDWISSPEVTKAFWDFERDITTLFADTFPTILAGKAYKGRQRLFDAFIEYFRKGGQERGSELVKVRYNSGIRNGLTLEHIARGETALLFGILPNVVASTFWTILHVFSQPTLLQELRTEIETVVSTSSSHTDSATHLIDITKLRAHCPLFVSVYQEAMRLRSTNASVRKVLADTLVGDYLFAKDAIVQMPSVAIHNNPAFFGPDPQAFDPRRFLKPDPGSASKGPKRPPGAFRVFGGGATLCPGRHFASTEILGFVSALVMGFDIMPASGGWVIPKPMGSRLMTAILGPVADVRVRVERREGWENVRWGFVTSKATTEIEMDTL